MEKQLDQEEVSFSSKDGVLVHGAYNPAFRAAQGAVLLIHGITEDRNEAFGFYEKLSCRLCENHFHSLRIDLRGHGKSDLSYADLTLFNAISDIESSLTYLSNKSETRNLHLIGTSFGGGIAALFAAFNHVHVKSLVLLCPNLDYRRNWLDSKPFWSGDALTAEGVRTLQQEGSIPHGEFRISASMLHELIHVRPFESMSRIAYPCLTIHGTADSVVPDNLSVLHYKCNPESELIRVNGADHGFADPDDDDFSSPVTAANHDRVFAAVVSWLMRHSCDR